MIPDPWSQDIVVPFMAMSSHDRFVIETPLRPGNENVARNKTFFFSGGVCGSGRYNALPPNCTYYKQQRYSGGVRQKVRIMWKWNLRVRCYVVLLRSGGQVCGPLQILCLILILASWQTHNHLICCLDLVPIVIRETSLITK